MRVIAGEARGRRLRPVAGRRVRPTADRVREALFSILAARHPEALTAPVLDLFAGTGALGIEALSRGAPRGAFVESDRAAAAVIRDNLAVCGFAGRAVVHARRVADFQAGPGADPGGYGLVLLDPPYAEQAALAGALAALDGRLLAPGAVVAAEHGAGAPPPEAVGSLSLELRRAWGDSAVSLYGAAAGRSADSTAAATRS